MSKQRDDLAGMVEGWSRDQMLTALQFLLGYDFHAVDVAAMEVKRQADITQESV
jgi:hypothetical protein